MLPLGTHWSDVNNRKRFFMEFAESRGFDPLVPENWSNITPAIIFAAKVFSYNNNNNIILM